MNCSKTIQDIMGPASSKKISLDPPWLITGQGGPFKNFEKDLIQEYRRPQTTLKAMRLSVAHALYFGRKLVFTLGERTLEAVVRGDPNWVHFGGTLPKFTKGHLGQYYKELEGLGVIGITKARPHSKVAPIFMVTKESPLRTLINADFEQQLKEAWAFATPSSEDIRLPEIVAEFGLVPTKCHKKEMKNVQKKMHSNLHTSIQEIELEKDLEVEPKLGDGNGSSNSSFLQLGRAPQWRQ